MSKMQQETTYCSFWNSRHGAAAAAASLSWHTWRIVIMHKKKTKKLLLQLSCISTSRLYYYFSSILSCQEKKIQYKYVETAAAIETTHDDEFCLVVVVVVVVVGRGRKHGWSIVCTERWELCTGNFPGTIRIIIITAAAARSVAGLVDSEMCRLRLDTSHANSATCLRCYLLRQERCHYTSRNRFGWVSVIYIYIIPNDTCLTFESVVVVMGFFLLYKVISTTALYRLKNHPAAACISHAFHCYIVLDLFGYRENTCISTSSVGLHWPKPGNCPGPHCSSDER